MDDDVICRSSDNTGRSERKSPSLMDNTDIGTLNSGELDCETEYSSQGKWQDSNGDSDDNDTQLLEENSKVNYQKIPKNSNCGGYSSGDKSEDKEAQKTDLRGKYERKLARFGQKIKELEVSEVDFDAEDDYNSNYLLLQKYKKKFADAYNKLCDLTSCSHLTGRPTQKKITLKNHNVSSEYPDIDTAVEKLINKVEFLQNGPYYKDILETAQKVNESESLGLSEEKVDETAQNLYDGVMGIIKKQRGKDFKMSMLAEFIPTPKATKDSSNPGCSSGSNSSIDDDVDEELEKQFKDPADSDPELFAKLQENIKLRKSGSDSIDKIARMVEKTGARNLDYEDATSDSDDDEKVRPAKRMRADEN